MKNGVIIFIFLVVSNAFYSQKDSLSVNEKNVKTSLETQFYPRLNSGIFEPNIKARFIFSDQHVLRSNLMFNYQNNKREILESNGNGVGSVETVSQNVLMSLGYEYIFNTNKLRPYLGIELLFGVGKDEVYGSRTDSIVFVSDFNYSSKVSSNNIGLGVFSGFDFFISDGLYVGTELGFQLLATKFSRGEFKQMDASSTTAPEIVTAIPENKVSSLGNSGVGVIRIGWSF
jgi:opacity protein-like surface antigen